VFDIFNINYYSLLFWIFYTLTATIIILAQFYIVLDQAKQKEFSERMGDTYSLGMWRLKTAGGYVALLVLVFSLGIIR